MRGLRRRLFGLSPNEATFQRRGFRQTDERTQHHLERIGLTFLRGYHLALEREGPAALCTALEEVALDDRGFAFEGAAMALALLDSLFPWQRGRLVAFLNGGGDPHRYMIHVGAGFVLGRLPIPVDWLLAGLDPLLSWLAIDGYGFHEGYFSWQRAIRRQERPRKLSGYALRAFDQGLGRSLWFVEGAQVERIEETIRRFPAARRADLWSGVGLASTYAGGQEPAALERLRDHAGEHHGHLAQGAAFAAKARERAHNMTPACELACTIFCGCSASEAAAVTDQALQALPPDGVEPAFESWRGRIRSCFT